MGFSLGQRKAVLRHATASAGAVVSLCFPLAACGSAGPSVSSSRAQAALREVQACHEVVDLSRGLPSSPLPAIPGSGTFVCHSVGGETVAILYVFPSSEDLKDARRGLAPTLLRYTSVGSNVLFTTDDAGADSTIRRSLALER